MQSPVANKQAMQRITLEEGLSAYQCPESDGIFLTQESYWRWLSRQPERLPHLPAASETSPEALDSDDAKICPESGQLMQRFKVGHGFSFCLDRSPNGNIWFDSGEWQALRERQFHDELHLIFTAPWQQGIRSEEKLQAEHKHLTEQLGPELLNELGALAQTLSEHPARELALAYLHRSSQA
ncbi:hypothetical protein Rhal01_02198 [Rubritalea halochordaticola]|uniref:Uncharacterized protein n=1 Tax=Rubritalea halochordaticola TaxID=714537 RepID=A0ABP9V047_9BACT